MLFSNVDVHIRHMEAVQGFFVAGKAGHHTVVGHGCDHLRTARHTDLHGEVEEDRAHRKGLRGIVVGEVDHSHLLVREVHLEEVSDRNDRRSNEEGFFCDILRGVDYILAVAVCHIHIHRLVHMDILHFLLHDDMGLESVICVVALD
jgi:hypothetical protein